MNLSEAIETKYSRFNYLGAEGKEEQAKAIQYAESLASRVGTPIHAWNLLEVLGDGKKIETDKNKINQRFFSYLELVKEKTPAAVALPESTLNAISKANLAVKTRMLRTVTEKIHEQQETYNSYTRDLDNTLRNLVTLQREKDLIEGVTATKVQGELEAIARSSFWEFFEHSPDHISFVTRAKVILTHEHKTAGVSLRVDMGRFRASINLVKGTVTAHPYADNLSVRGYYHPHVMNGNVCWGSATDRIKTLIPQQRYAEVFDILSTCLTHYNADSPYVTLETFQALNPNSAPVGVKQGDLAICDECEMLKIECRCCDRCGNHQDDCDCCSNCNRPREGGCDCCSDCGNTADSCECNHQDGVF